MRRLSARFAPDGFRRAAARGFRREGSGTLKTLAFNRHGAAVHAALATALLASGAHAAKLNIGDPAPALQPAVWLKGAAIPQFEKGHVYVVEFWATWCGPCKANIPRLTELAKKYQGKAEIIGMDIWESQDPTINTLPKSTAFVKSQGARMDYHVAADTLTNRVADSWMKAAGEGGIPTAFIVGKDGKIAWIGNPAAGLDDALGQVVANKFDVAAAGVEREKQVGPMQAIEQAMADKDYAGAIKLIDAEEAKNPASSRGLDFLRLTALAHTDQPEYQKQARAILTQRDGDIGAYQMLASIPASAPDLSPDAYQFGLTLVDEAMQKKEMDRGYLFLAMRAAMDTNLGRKDDAVKDQTASVKAAETDSHCPPEFLEFLRKNLDKDKAAAGQ